MQIMKAEIRYIWGKDYLLVDLGNRTETRIRMIYWIEFLVTTGLATILLLESFKLQKAGMQLLVNGIIGMVYLLAAYRFLSRMFFREKLLVSNSFFTIIRETPFSKSRASYDWKSMGVLHYQGKSPKTDHPLKGKNFDYFGFDTQEYLVQHLHHDGNLFFEHQKTPVRFARGIYSWHAEEIIRMIQIFSGPALRLGAEWESIMQEMDWEE